MTTERRPTTKVAIMFTVVCFFPTPSTAGFAFQPEIIGQALDVAAHSIDEVLFAAVNLLGPQQRPLVMEAQSTRASQRMPNITFPSAPNITLPQLSLFGKDPDEVFLYEDVIAQPLSCTISLTQEEIELFRVVREVRDQYCRSTTLRIGGGWVRDKLLNRCQASPDIDFVLDNKSGNEFAQLVQQYYLSKESVPAKDASKITTATLKDYTATQSGHLQTASLRIENLDVDFNQLRFERYDRDSRVPSKAGVASVVEDAFRRDLTINSLYYNLNTNQVEDWTEEGLRDLRFRNIRTPNAPLPTFIEDPLRILRAIRFSSQLSFSMDPTLKEAALNKRVKQSLKQKVSRERIGKEVDAIFQSVDPQKGIELLIETKLIDLVFPLEARNACRIYEDGYHQLCRTQTLMNRVLQDDGEWNQDRRRLLLYAAYFKPIGSEESISNKLKSNRSKLHKLLVTSLKQPVKDARIVQSVVEGAYTMQRLLRQYDRSSPLRTLDPKDDSTIAVVKEKKAVQLRWLCYMIIQRIGPYWKDSLILALSSSPEFDPLEAVNRYTGLVSSFKDLVGLSGKLLDLKPVLNGGQIKKVLPGIQGEYFREVLKAQERWQVEQSIDGSTATGDDEVQNQLELHLRRTFPQFL